MKRWFTIAKWVLVGCFLLLALVLILAHQIHFYPTEKVLQKQFTEKGFQAPALHIIDTEYGPVTIIDNQKESELPIIVFLHGSPGSSQDFRLYFQDSRLEGFRIISINRLGFAKEGYGNNELDLTKQANSYLEAMNKICGSCDVIWVGHSYGGAPAAVTASLATERTVSLIIAAAPIDPEHEKLFWFNHVAKIPHVFWVLPKTLQMAQKEKMSHSKELKKVEHRFQEIKSPIYVLQGDQDFMSPMENVDYAESIFVNSVQLTTKRIEGQSHFFPFQGREHIVNAILELAKD